MFTIPFSAAIWVRMTADYVQKVTEGARCLTQLGIKSDGMKESKRLARHSQGWQFPHTLCMESSKGYWGRYVLPKTDLETGRAEYRGALPKVLASFGAMAGMTTKPPDDTDFGKPKVKGRKCRGKGGKPNANTLTSGGTEVTRLYPAGKRLLKPERNLAMAHAPRCGKYVFFWDWNAHGGGARTPHCDRKHETMSEENLHWAIASELIRRGGHKNIPTRIAPGNVDGMVDQLRESNQKIHGNNHW